MSAKSCDIRLFPNPRRYNTSPGVFEKQTDRKREMTDSLAAHYLQDAVRVLRAQKQLADGAAAQVSDEEFFRVIDAESNSIALIMKHMAGNMRSRWTDFLTSDGEKPDRHRDSEFLVEGEDRAAILERWEAGWRTVFDTLESLKPEDIARPVIIRGEPHTV